MRGPGSDSGTTAMYGPDYDALLAHIVGEPLKSLTVLTVSTEDGRRGTYTWKYEPDGAYSVRRSVDESPHVRLGSVMAAVRACTGIVEAEGLVVA